MQNCNIAKLQDQIKKNCKCGWCLRKEKNVCTHSFWTNFCIFLFFLLSYTCCSSPSLHQNTSLKWLTPSFFKCIRDVIQVEQTCYACCIKWYTSILLNLYNIPLFYMSSLTLLSSVYPFPACHQFLQYFILKQQW